MDPEMGMPSPNPNNAYGEPPSPSPSPSPRAPALVVSNSSKSLAVSNSAKALLVSNSAKALLASSSSKRMDASGKKKYVKQVTGKHNDTELHLAAQRGDLAAVRLILEEINEQMLKTMTGAEFDAEVAEIRAAMVNEVNELGETALFTAAERGYIDVVKELLPYTTKEGITIKNRSGFDALHIAANQGHEAATKGHAVVVNELLTKDSSLLEIAKSNGKNALHFASRQGHVEVVKVLLGKDPQLARRTDKKGQTALHMAAKGTSSKVVRLLLQADAATVMLPDKFGNTALHVATRKKRVEIVNELLLIRDTNVNALTRDNKTSLDIAEGLSFCEEIGEIKECLTRFGAIRAKELNQPRDELRKTVTEIKKDVHTQLEHARKTNKNMNGIAKELRKLHREGINNATNSVTVVAVLFATVAFSAIFTVPGGDDEDGKAVMVGTSAFKIFFISNAVALFTSLAVVVVQITVVRREIKSERRVVEVINKLMWLASVCTTLAFVSSAYIVVGKRHRFAAVLVTVIGGVIMAGVLGSMTYYVVKYKRIRKVRKKQKFSRGGGNNSWRYSDFSESEVNSIYAI
ncbi:hypothetical protein DM860_004264 [Cuscuta australis]|uniref:PGG domain-containing protein n=1 Tax=Cuscuta australis TaxID=267555 RepID=A0A328EB47_9ASTE|nr:hypothetical protein DM860_004264 [Cuscuta australis]